MSTVALWISIFVNTGTAVGLMLHYRKQVREGLLGHTGAKKAYSWASLLIGFVVAPVAFYLLVRLSDAPIGHGEILIAAPIFNAVLSLALLFIGRIVISWRPLQW